MKKLLLTAFVLLGTVNAFAGMTYQQCLDWNQVAAREGSDAVLLCAGLSGSGLLGSGSMTCAQCNANNEVLAKEGSNAVLDCSSFC